MTDAARTVQEPFDALMSAQFDAAVVIDPESGAFLAANPAAEALLGYSRPELLGMTPADIHPHEMPRLDAFLRHVRAAGAWTADDLSCRTSGGDTVPALLRATMIAQGGAERILLLIRDRREKRLADLGEAVRRLSHDLKNTLATAQLMADRLAAHPDDRVRLSAESMTRALDRAAQLAQDAARAGRARQPAPQRERFLLDDVLEEVQATVAGVGVAEQRLIDASPRPVILDADFDQVYRILLNLVRNAFDAGAREVAIRGRPLAGGGAELEVRDDGPGLPERVVARLGQEQGGGRSGGLGLMIASELCRNHGGALAVAETGPEGTAFRVTLPAAAPA